MSVEGAVSPEVVDVHAKHLRVVGNALIERGVDVLLVQCVTQRLRYGQAMLPEYRRPELTVFDGAGCQVAVVTVVGGDRGAVFCVTPYVRQLRVLFPVQDPDEVIGFLLSVAGQGEALA